MAATLRQLLTAERESKARLERAMAMAEQGAMAARVGRGDLAARVNVEEEGELAALGGNLNRLIILTGIWMRYGLCCWMQHRASRTAAQVLIGREVALTPWKRGCQRCHRACER